MVVHSHGENEGTESTHHRRLKKPAGVDSKVPKPGKLKYNDTQYYVSHLRSRCTHHDFNRQERQICAIYRPRAQYGRSLNTSKYGVKLGNIGHGSALHSNYAAQGQYLGSTSRTPTAPRPTTSRNCRTPTYRTTFSIACMATGAMEEPFLPPRPVPKPRGLRRVLHSRHNSSSSSDT